LDASIKLVAYSHCKKEDKNKILKNASLKIAILYDKLFNLKDKLGLNFYCFCSFYALWNLLIKKRKWHYTGNSIFLR
jgi:hypothetical protein